MTTLKKTRSLTGFYPVHAEPKDAIVTLDLDRTFFALKGYHIKMNNMRIVISWLAKEEREGDDCISQQKELKTKQAK